MRALGLLIAIAVGSAGLIAQPKASAATGDLTYLECIRYSGVNRDGCGALGPSIGGVKKTVVSPDGKFVHVVGTMLTTYSRDPVTGNLTWVRCHGPEVPCTALQGLGNVQDLILSADGRNLYTSQYSADRVTAYSRNLDTGDLTFVNCIEDATDPSGECTTAPAMDGQMGLTISDVGQRNLYSVSQTSFGVVWFQRDVNNGGLSFRGCMTDSSRPRIGSCYIVPGMGLPSSIEASPDGTAVYVGGYNTVLGLTRSTTSGDLSYAECYGTDLNPSDSSAPAPSNCETRPGIYTVIDMVFSADGKNLYAISDQGEAIMMFLRAQGADTAYYSCWRDVRKALHGCNEAIYIARPRALDLSKDGKTLYVTGMDSHSVAPFNRNLNLGGRLEQRGCFLDAGTTGLGCTARVQGLGGATGVTVSPDNNTVYVAGEGEQALVRFRREFVPSSFEAGVIDTTIMSGPKGTTPKHRVKFSFTSNEANATYLCSIDRKTFRPCSSPWKSPKLSSGNHRFRVAAVDAAGNRDAKPAVRRFTVS